MFDHVKHVQGWTTIGCHVYDMTYCKVLTIATCDMESNDVDSQVLMWSSLTRLVKKVGIIENVNFKGFMANNAQTNFNAMMRMFGFGDPTIPMVGRKHICLMHWVWSMEVHIRHLIKVDLLKEHKRLCHQYKK